MKSYKHIILNIPQITFCFLFVLLPLFSIGQSPFSISGTILNEDGEVPNTTGLTVILSGDDDQTIVVNDDGTYFFQVQEGGNYTITPQNNSNILNGVSTYDLILLDQHLQGINILDSPYKIIAADINHDELITGTDSVDLRNVLIAVSTEFPNNTSYRFVPNDHNFSNPFNPWSNPFPESIDVLNVEGAVNDIDFVSIKIGDLNVTNTFFMPGSACSQGCGFLSGNVFYDTNEDCSYNNTETNLQDWKISATANGDTYYTTTNAFGEYSIALSPGDYTIEVLTPNDFWLPCQSTHEITIEEEVNDFMEFPIQALEYCPSMDSDFGTSLLRRCIDNTASLKYCNQGTITANDASLVVSFDPSIIVSNSSPVWTDQVENVFTFDLGDLDVNECGTIAFTMMADCDVELGQTLCIETQAFPESCYTPEPLWDGSTLEINANCNNELVTFNVTNTGDPMLDPVTFFVIEDDMIMDIQDNEIILTANDSQVFEYPANGSTWRMEIDQGPDHPFATMVSEAIEACGENNMGTFSMGFINQFSNYPASPNTDIECLTVVGSFDPNDKSATPAGIQDEHFLEPNVPLEYLIRFQNTGTDTAFTVVVLDTLSPLLDISTVKAGASSHAYEFNLIGSNVIEFRFDNIMLPDSNVNQAASNGFIKFEVEQLIDNPLGAIIKNDAAIYFDFNEPIITNTVMHTLFMPFDNQTIGGIIAREDGDPIQNVIVQLEGDIEAVAYTDQDGAYEFEVNALGDYTVTPFYDAFPLNGVSTLDLVLITKHIEAEEFLDSPYKIIAADVNNSKLVDVTDTMDLKELLLGIQLTFPNNTSWRFVDAAHTFTDPMNPWSTSFPEAIQYSNPQTDFLNQDFVAIKTGDVNYTALTNLSIINNTPFTTTETFTISIAPNPIHHSAQFRLEGISIDNGTLRIYDLYGKQVQTLPFSGDSIDFYRNGLANGLYLFELTSNGQRMSTGKLLLQ